MEYDIGELAQETALKMDLTTPQAKMALELSLENVLIFDKKQQDYGSGNISNNPMPEFGVAIRANDKIQRIMHLLAKKGTPINEAREDSWMDLANYALIGYLVAKGLWSAADQ
jgi:hypothetical protein